MKNKHTKIPKLVILCALFVFIFTNLFSFFIFKHIPRVHDEIANLFQAKIFKSGKLYTQSPCEKEFFNFTHVINNGKWYSQYTPGYPFILLIGLIAGMPWLINPLLAALSIILFYFMGKEIYTRQIGLIAALLGAVSIWFLLMSSTMMSHTSSLFFTSLFLLFLFRSLRKPSVLNGFLAGLGLGVAFLIRPYNAVLISIPFLLYYAAKILKEFKPRMKNVIVFGLMMIISVSALLVYNQITNGHPLKMGYIVRYGEDHGIGFGREGYTGVPHTPLLGVLNIVNYFKALSRDIFGWPISSFFALLPLLWLTRIKPEDRKKDLLLVAGFFSLMVGLFIYWGTFVFIGARMCFETLPILFLLSARGLTELPRLLSLKFKWINQFQVKKIGVAILIIFTLYAFFIRLRSWIWPQDTEWYYDGFANNFAGVTPRIHHTLKSLVSGETVVILKFLYHPFEHFPYGWWSSGFLYNDPQLRGNIIYALDQGSKNVKLFRCFPERKIYLYLGTIEKGMLVPLIKRGDKVIYGEPVYSVKHDKKSIELIKNPLELYTVYSPVFRDFLNSLYGQIDFAEIDVARLVKMGVLCKKEKDFKEAAFHFESALQIEKNPFVLTRILNQLLPCYLKSREYTEAKRITAIIYNKKKSRIYNLLPERGF